MKHEILSWNTFFLVPTFIAHVSHQQKIAFTEKRYCVKFNNIKKYLLLIKQKQKKNQKYQNVSEWNHIRKPGATYF